jgi:signal recognition particle GTPase
MISHRDLEVVEKQPAPFELELYMDETRKKSLSGIVSSYLHSVSSNSDSNSTTRKDRGMKILLLGSSGTGKTFTAGKPFASHSFISVYLSLMF